MFPKGIINDTQIITYQVEAQTPKDLGTW